MNADSSLIFEHVSKEYSGRFSLGPLDFSLTRGVTCLVGPNGAGKTTLFKMAAGMESATTGKIYFTEGEKEIVSGRVGYLPQDVDMPVNATCEEFLHYVAWAHRVPAQKRSCAVEDALTHVNLTERRTHKIRSLSGGMVRRLGVASALINDPLLLLLDEPTVGLDPRQRLSLRRVISAAKGTRMVLVSTHLVEDIRSIADRVIVLGDGKIVFDGNVSTLEEFAEDEAPGDSAVERALAVVMGSGE